MAAELGFEPLHAQGHGRGGEVQAPHRGHAALISDGFAQGLTNDRALIAIDTQSRTTSMNLSYVVISRARHEARVYVNG